MISLFSDSTLSLKDINKNNLSDLSIDVEKISNSTIVYGCLFCKHEIGYKKEMEHCPFCGVTSIFIVPAYKMFEYDVGVINKIEKKDLMFTLQLEIANYKFYKEIEDGLKNMEWRTYFRYIRRHEEYHKNEVADILDVSNPDDSLLEEVEPLKVPETLSEQLQKSIRIEEESIEFYKKAEQRTDNSELKSIYKGLINSESYHVNILSDKRK